MQLCLPVIWLKNKQKKKHNDNIQLKKQNGKKRWYIKIYAVVSNRRTDTNARISLKHIYQHHLAEKALSSASFYFRGLMGQVWH